MDAKEYEASVKGTEKTTVSFLNRYPMVAIIVFILAIISATTWGEALLVFVSEYIFHVPRGELRAWMLALTALTITLLTWVIARYIFRLPVTAVFSL